MFAITDLCYNSLSGKTEKVRTAEIVRWLSLNEYNFAVFYPNNDCAAATLFFDNVFVFRWDLDSKNRKHSISQQNYCKYHKLF